MVTQDMVRAYCVQRADLRAYHAMLETWSDTSSEPIWKQTIGRFLSAVDEIEDDTKAVLDLLAGRTDAPCRT